MKWLPVRHVKRNGATENSTAQNESPGPHQADGQPSSSQAPDGRQQQPMPHSEKGTYLGLRVLYSPPVDRVVDIVFIHGLGGSSIRTWCKKGDLKTLWPQTWIPEEFPAARTLTFGYHAHFSTKKERTALKISDFATDLLFQMKYSETGQDKLGQVPIVIVAHSMGGLVFKKAFAQGHLKEDFRDLVSKIKAAIFLATPHGGTDLAQALNMVLSGSVFGHSPKDYVAELAKKSPTIDEIDESFRQHAWKLKIFSFYETLSTPIGPMQVMILDKNSSTMGYPNETSQPLIANHHQVCKFSSPEDVNYKSIMGALRSVIQPLLLLSSEKEDTAQGDLTEISAMLSVFGPPDGDLSARRALRAEDTCDNLFVSQPVQNWLSPESPSLLWIHAGPGSGKSVACSYVVDKLLEKTDGYYCAYFFFNHEDAEKRSLSTMLRSLAYQMAVEIPQFRQAFAELARSGIQLYNASLMTIWTKLFVSVVAKVKVASSRGICWVIDGADESESSRQLIEFISSVVQFETPIKVIMFSRPLTTIEQTIKLVGKTAQVTIMPLPDNRDDVRLVATRRIAPLPSNDDFKQQIIDSIASRSQGSFLWASLVLNRVVDCHLQEQVKLILESTPDGMNQVYNRMIISVASLETEEEKRLAKIFFSWAMYAKAPVTTEELISVYPSTIQSIMNVKHTVAHVCGQFVNIDAHNRVTLVHNSAHQFLAMNKDTSLSLDPATINEELFGKCIVTLCHKNFQEGLSSFKFSRFLPYAAMSWTFHLSKSSTNSDRILQALVKFFTGPYPFAWIQYLAMSGHLAELLDASQKLAAYVSNRRLLERENTFFQGDLIDLTLLETWATDLLRIPGRFGSHLTQDPTAIYKLVPPLCPSSSAIYRIFASQTWQDSLIVSGLSRCNWDDSLARVSVGTGRAQILACSSQHLAVAIDVPQGTITLWDTNLFQEHRTLNVGGYICAMEFDPSGLLFACYTSKTTFVWKVNDMNLEISATNPRHERALDLKFKKDGTLIMVSDIRCVYQLVARASDKLASWERLDHTLLEETNVPKGTWLSTPSSVVFSPDCTQIAVAYLSFPLAVWNMNPPKVVARIHKGMMSKKRAVYSYTGSTDIAWHPSGTEIFGIFGEIFKWNPMEDTYSEVKNLKGVVPHAIECSPSGMVFMTCDVEGNIHIYDASSMLPIYKLTSENSICQVAFSPNGLRFYDIRGSYCNVWEPDCLIKLSNAVPDPINEVDGTSDSFWTDIDDAQSTSISLAASESQAENRPGVVAIAGCHPNKDLLTFANDQHVIHIYKSPNGPRHILKPAVYPIGVHLLVWDSKHEKLAYSLAYGETCVKQVVQGAILDQEISCSDIYVDKSSGRGRSLGLFFNNYGNLLFIHGEDQSQVISLEDGCVIAERDSAKEEAIQWKQSPSDPDVLFCFAINSVTAFTWKLEAKCSVKLDMAESLVASGLDPSTTHIDAILDSHSPSYFLLRIASWHLNRQRYNFRILPANEICALFKDDKKPDVSESVRPIDISTKTQESAENTVGILPNSQLVFLDRNLWVCTVPLDRDGDVTRHFFIPRNWVTDSGIRLSSVLRDGTLLFPSGGEIALIESDVGSEWLM